MYTDVQIANLGLAKLSSSRVRVLAPPRTELEIFIADGYPAWRRSELTKRRWVFATVYGALLTLSGTTDDEYRPNKFALPNDCLRPIRQDNEDWRQSGKFLHTGNSELRISYVQNLSEDQFDPLFVDVLACRVAVESCEYVTQSNTKLEAKKDEYRMAVDEAKKANAFVIGSEDISDSDEAFSFITARYG